MKLLILTQAIDLDDPGLGFFHSWVEELSKKFETVSVVCLQEGPHHLPRNARVYSLGKENGRSRIKYVSRFYRYIFSLRAEYDAVFVHMNSEYVVLGGLLWRLWGKRVVLWRNHKMKGFSTWLSAYLAHTICYTSPSAYVKRFKNAVRMPIGIDTSLFVPAAQPALDNSVLLLGRVDAVKHVDVFLAAIDILSKKGLMQRVDVIGDPTPGREAYAREVAQRFKHLLHVAFQKSIPNTETAAVYRSHAIYVNITPSGSFDKTIGEAAASGCILVAANEVLRGVLPDQLIVSPTSAEDVARGVEAALNLSEEERSVLRNKLREYVVREHSLALLVEKLMPVLKA